MSPTSLITHASKITIQCGQAGNQLGLSLWQALCLEHGLDQSGVVRPLPTSLNASTGPSTLQAQTAQAGDRKDVFFTQSDDDTYIPRAICIDTEPRVIRNSLLSGSHGALFNNESIYVDKSGGGAANNWAKGYNAGERAYDDVMEMLEREAEASDSLEAFNLIHSVAGGTGSGLGSFILEKIADRFPKKLTQTYSVFPNNEPDGATDTVMQAYNSLLASRHLTEHADSVYVLDNGAIMRIVAEGLKLKAPTLDETNRLVSTVMAASSLTLRFPGYMNNDLVGITASLVPTPRCHFLTTSYTPFSSEQIGQVRESASSSRPPYQNA